MRFVRHTFISPPKTFAKHSDINVHQSQAIKRVLYNVTRVACLDSHDQWRFWSGVREICNYRVKRLSEETYPANSREKDWWTLKFADGIWQIRYLSLVCDTCVQYVELLDILMVFTVTSLDCKVKKARFYEFLLTLGWRLIKNKSLYKFPAPKNVSFRKYSNLNLWVSTVREKNLSAWFSAV